MREEVSTIMRYLGLYPSEEDVVMSILPMMQDDILTAFVSYEPFERCILEFMREGEFAPDTEDTLLAAFRVLDPENNGFVDADRMSQLLMSKGSAFREKEVEQFLDTAKDKATGHIYYEDYIALVTTDQ